MPITTDEQRAVLADAQALAGAGSLIPAAMSYRDQLNRFKAQTARAGIDHVHGLRHAYAQARYLALTGAGGRRAHLEATDRRAEGDGPCRQAGDLGRARAREGIDHRAYLGR